MAIDRLKEALRIDRVGFIKGLLAAGYVDTVVYSATANDDKMIELAANMYNDVWDAFNTTEFESYCYYLA